MSVHFVRDAPFRLEIVGQYPAVGSVSQTAIVGDGLTGDPLNGFLVFAADTRDGWAFVEFDLAGEIVSEGGDATVVNGQLEPVLATSSTWKDAHTLILAFARIAGLDSSANLLPGLAIPVPSAAGDSDVLHAKRTCGAAIAACIVTVLLPPTLGGCGAALGACFAANACAELDCAGDGYGP